MGVKPYSRTAELKSFLENMGKGLPVPFELTGERKGIRMVTSSILILKVLQREGLVFFPMRKFEYTYKGKKRIGIPGSIAVEGNTIFLDKQYKKDAEDFQKSKARFGGIVITTADAGHVNMLVLDKVKKTASFFEPNGYTSKDVFISEPEKMVKKFLELYGLDDYTVKYDESVCPFFGAQAVEGNAPRQTGYCQTWSQLFLYCKVHFPELDDVEIQAAFVEKRFPKEVRDMVERFAAFAWDKGEKDIEMYNEPGEENIMKLWFISCLPRKYKEAAMFEF
ncbi:hypothetical protein GMAR_ORF149 [Golden Marseillevirus]|uniref:hypothetical protein n=1 Tax=Golden Marseillevirus TaxID=1720526 RepID=UPI000877AD9C|nr:hypothetical protein GMAR_ORF149 [Golden Marseillevirus]ALX27523.1 hypothetical protein GMAR_ORF149 [Golden Marseillevirus]